MTSSCHLGQRRHKVSKINDVTSAPAVFVRFLGKSCKNMQRAQFSACGIRSEAGLPGK